MPLPVTFMALPAGDNTAALLDVQFAAVASLVFVPCTAIGAASIDLTPMIDAPTITHYTDLAPVFSFIAPQTSTGTVTINVNALGAFPAFKNRGAAPAANGDLVANLLYFAVYSSAANSGGGGFIIF